MRAAIPKPVRAALPSIAAVAAAFLVCAVVLAAVGYRPLDAYATLASGAFGDLGRVAETLVKMIPILVIALGTSVAFKAQLWNIGGNGQYTIGAIAAVSVCLYAPLPPGLRIALSFLASVAAGLLYGVGVGLMKAKFNANEVITTLMLDYVSAFFLSWLVYGPMKDPGGFGFPQTPLLSQDLMLPSLLPGARLHAGLFLALALVLVLWLFWRTRLGFMIGMVGESPDVASASGIDVSRNVITTMAISAAFAAVAGWIDALGLYGRLQDNLPGSLGTVAVVVALLGRLNPFGIALSSLLFSALLVGGNTMQRFVGVPFSIVTIIEGLVIVFVICGMVIERVSGDRRKVGAPCTTISS